MSSNTISEIRQAVNAGRVVTTHTDPVMVPGWQGAGYVVLDPETGSGAWLIEGGLNGGFISVDGLLKFLDMILSIGSILVEGLTRIVASAASVIISLYRNTKTFIEECDGLWISWGVFFIIPFLAIGFFITALLVTAGGIAGIVAAVIFAIAYAFMLDQLVKSAVRVCRGR